MSAEPQSDWVVDKVYSQRRNQVQNAPITVDHELKVSCIKVKLMPFSTQSSAHMRESWLYAEESQITTTWKVFWENDSQPKVAAMSIMYFVV
jgi:hypothetical protein